MFVPLLAMREAERSADSASMTCSAVQICLNLGWDVPFVARSDAPGRNRPTCVNRKG
jgi:hypothetical protein